MSEKPPPVPVSATTARGARHDRGAPRVAPLIVGFDFAAHRSVVPHFAVLRLEPRELITGTLLPPKTVSGPPSLLETINRMTPGRGTDAEIWAISEFSPRRRSTAGAAIRNLLAAFPRTRTFALGIWDILSGIGFAHRPGETYPTAEQVHDAVIAKAGAAFKPASFEDTWTAAVALAGAAAIGTVETPTDEKHRRRATAKPSANINAPAVVAQHQHLITVRQLSAMLNISKSSAHRIAGIIGVFRLPAGGLRVRREDVDRFLAEHYHRGESDDGAAGASASVASPAVRSGTVAAVTLSDDDEVLPGLSRRELKRRLAALRK